VTTAVTATFGGARCSARGDEPQKLVQGLRSGTRRLATEPGALFEDDDFRRDQAVPAFGTHTSRAGAFVNKGGKGIS